MASHLTNKTKPVVDDVDDNAVDFTDSASKNANLSNDKSVKKTHLPLTLAVSSFCFFVFIYFKTILIDILTHAVHDTPLEDTKVTGQPEHTVPRINTESTESISK
jgi:hypothetical protein